jgi:hypothetical protein
MHQRRIQRARLPLIAASLSAAALCACGSAVESVQSYAAASPDAHAATSATATATAVATPSGPVAHGEGFTFSVPAGWHNQPTAVGESAATVVADAPPDVVVLGAATAGFASNVNVVHYSGFESRDLDLAVSLVEEIVKQRLNATPVGAVEKLTVGGEPAVAYTVSYTYKGQSIRARQVLTSHYLQLRAVTLTSAAPAFNHDLADFQGMLASWVWR